MREAHEQDNGTKKKSKRKKGIAQRFFHPASIFRIVLKLCRMKGMIPFGPLGCVLFSAASSTH